MVEQIEYSFLKRNDEIPYYFNEEDVLQIFSVVHNIKHLAMLQTIFYGCLRASELCKLDDRDLDPKGFEIESARRKMGKGWNSPINNECDFHIKTISSGSSSAGY